MKSHSLAARDGSDPDSGDFDPWLSGEEQLVVFAIVQGFVERCAREQRDAIEVGRDAGGFRETILGLGHERFLG